ncbi:mechanosensitive ion channel family protein [Erysipelothrix inopinata]|uniref:Mechanosensitive ion channel family protein n=1 Tax=Erysipelothrix inopinata TaxID=225084 RepID=A0A7G9RZB1_9FIRM|nr:mechanosensitive ion channel family protein [Erysipelothrix inopinata]QNN60936.1 mechanosensitive ion channel family protein [Erysipelothrix inopinata]
MKQTLINFFSNSGVQTALFKILYVVIVIGVTRLLVRFLNKTLKKIFKNKELDQKQKTLFPIVKNAFKFLIYFIAFCFLLEILGISTTPFLAIASAMSVAIGFGAQQLVKDLISGFFILVEDQFKVNDVISVEDVTGTVEEISFRTTKLRNGLDGELYIIPNGEIKIVKNKTKDFMNAVVDIPIPYEVDVDRVLEILNDEFKNYSKPGITYSRLEVVGITSYNEFSYGVRVSCKTAVGKKWEIEMELRRRIKKALEKEGIDIAYQTMRVELNENEKKSA